MGRSITPQLPNPITTVSNGTTIDGLGTDNLDGAAINVTFNDFGDAAGVPDTVSALGLLAIALAGLVGVGRLRSIRLA